MEKKFNDVVFNDGEFSIRVGCFAYFISHDPCHDPEEEGVSGVSYALNNDYTPSLQYAGCKICAKIHPEEMETHTRGDK